MTENEKLNEALEDFEALCNGKTLCITGEALNMVISAVKKSQEFEAIGTIEEFKALKEKGLAKKPKKSGVVDSNGVFHVINGINGVPYDLCPNCEINLCTDGMFGENTRGMKYCKNCGQKLDYEYAKGKRDSMRKAIEIVNQLAEEYNNELVKDDLISRQDVFRMIEKQQDIAKGDGGTLMSLSLLKSDIERI